MKIPGKAHLRRSPASAAQSFSCSLCQNWEKAALEMVLEVRKECDRRCRGGKREGREIQSKDWEVRLRNACSCKTRGYERDSEAQGPKGCKSPADR
jgi:hypothetical protein